MSAAKPIGLGIVAGLFGAILVGFAINVTFDVLFSLLNLGNYKDRAIMGMLAAVAAAPAGFFFGLWLGIRTGGPAYRGLAIGCLFLASLFGAGVAAIMVTYALENERQVERQARMHTVSAAHVES